MPTLLVRGTTTAPWLSAVVGLLAKRLPQARLLELKGGDACILEGASEFVSAVADHTAAPRTPAPTVIDARKSTKLRVPTTSRTSLSD